MRFSLGASARRGGDAICVYLDQNILSSIRLLIARSADSLAPHHAVQVLLQLIILYEKGECSCD